MMPSRPTFQRDEHDQQKRQKLSRDVSQPLKLPKPIYRQGAGAQRVVEFMHLQRSRPNDNNIDFWRDSVAKFFAPNAKKKWDVLNCGICKRVPCHGFEMTFEALPRLFKVKYDSGVLEELLYTDMPRECVLKSGRLVVEYGKAVQEIRLASLRVVRYGQLRVIFTSELKICYWQFCVHQQKKFTTQTELDSQVRAREGILSKVQEAAGDESSISKEDVQSSCNSSIATSRELKIPVCDLGYPTTYVRFLQMAQVIKKMKDVMAYCQKTGKGPLECRQDYVSHKKMQQQHPCQHPRQHQHQRQRQHRPQQNQHQRQHPRLQQHQHQHQRQHPQQQQPQPVATLNNFHVTPPTTTTAATTAAATTTTTTTPLSLPTPVNSSPSTNNVPLTETETETNTNGSLSTVEKIIRQVMDSHRFKAWGGPTDNVSMDYQQQLQSRAVMNAGVNTQTTITKP